MTWNVGCGFESGDLNSSTTHPKGLAPVADKIAASSDGSGRTFYRCALAYTELQAPNGGRFPWPRQLKAQVEKILKVPTILSSSFLRARSKIAMSRRITKRLS